MPVHLPSVCSYTCSLASDQFEPNLKGSASSGPAVYLIPRYPFKTTIFQRSVAQGLDSSLHPPTFLFIKLFHFCWLVHTSSFYFPPFIFTFIIQYLDKVIAEMKFFPYSNKIRARNFNKKKKAVSKKVLPVNEITVV